LPSLCQGGGYVAKSRVVSLRVLGIALVAAYLTFNH
jgi:hypothetical protein